jgi:hypothetical protein
MFIMTQPTPRLSTRPLRFFTMALVASSMVGVPLISAQDKPKDAAGSFPVPSIYPKSWELKFEHGQPQRIVVDVGEKSPKAFWYLPYSVTNTTGREMTFLPMFEFLTKDGQVIRSDDKIPSAAFNAIKAREKNRFLESQYSVGGALRLGPDQAKDAVAIWAEPAAELGRFSIFVSGLSGEFAFLKDAKGEEKKSPDGKPIILRKTLQLNYLVRGDEVYPGEDAVNENAEIWVMR